MRHAFVEKPNAGFSQIARNLSTGLLASRARVPLPGTQLDIPRGVFLGFSQLLPGEGVVHTLQA